MANKNILTYGSGVTQAEQSFFLSTTIGASNKILSSTYCFLSNINPWPLNANTGIEIVSTPTQDQKYIKNIFKNMFVAKRINSSDISPVIQRVDWVGNIVYDYYRDDIDILQKHSNGLNVYNFYVRNSYGQVFKCLWNNNNKISVNEPMFQPGTYGTNNMFQSTDGYKWKYIYTIDKSSAQNFMDNMWMPVPVGVNTPNPLQSTAGRGNIDCINVLNGGYGYNPSASPISIDIIGDGTGAKAKIELVGSSISDITMLSTGTNYTFATSKISTAVGSGVKIEIPSSPIGGHGFDPISELGCNRTMYISQFNGNESGVLSTNVSYCQVGLLVDPVDIETYPNFAEDTIYNTCTIINVASGFGEFIDGETIYQGNSLETATFSATVLDFDVVTNTIQLINITGNAQTNNTIHGIQSLCTRTVLIVSSPKFVLHSGYITYIENRSHIQRSVDGIEQFKFVLEY